MKNYYQILNLPMDASNEDIKKSYKKLAIKWHPDKNKSHIALDKFKEISEAYQVLSDPEKRSNYNMSIQSHHHEPIFDICIIDPFKIFNEFIKIINMEFALYPPTMIHIIDCKPKHKKIMKSTTKVWKVDDHKLDHIISNCLITKNQ